jgi:hypothetical protein
MPDETTTEILHRFNAAFLKHDPGLLKDLIDDDCVLENSGPAPDGSRHLGGAECLTFWSGIAANTESTFEPEEIYAVGDRGIIRWRLTWGPAEDESVRGVNLMRVRAGKIVEGMGYVKGS